MIKALLNQNIATKTVSVFVAIFYYKMIKKLRFKVIFRKNHTHYKM